MEADTTIVPRKKKSSIYVYTRFPEINDNDEESDEVESSEPDSSEDMKGRPVHRRTQCLGAVAGTAKIFRS